MSFIVQHKRAADRAHQVEPRLATRLDGDLIRPPRTSGHILELGMGVFRSRFRSKRETKDAVDLEVHSLL